MNYFQQVLFTLPFTIRYRRKIHANNAGFLIKKFAYNHFKLYMSQVAIELTLSLLCSVVAFIMKHKCRKNILIWICYNNFKMCRSELCIRFWNVSWLLYHRFNYEIINNIVYCTLLWYFKISVINSRSNLLGQVLHKWREFKYFLELFMYFKIGMVRRWR